MNDGSLLKTPGELIGEARRAQSISLDDMAARTKIPPPMLRALEADEYHRISGPLYIKSFLRACAGELGLEPDEVLALYSSFAGEVGASPGDPVWEDEAVQISRIGFPWIRVVSGVVVAAALLLAAIFYIGRGCVARSERPQPAAVRDEPPAPTTVPDPARDWPDTLAGGGPQDAGPEAELAEQTSPAETIPTEEAPRENRAVNPPPATTPVERTPPRTSADAPPVVAGDPRLEFSGGRRWPVVLRILCREPVNVRLQRDGEGRHLRAIWPGADRQAPPLPDGDIEPGRVYAVREGLVVFWGAADHFSLSVDPVAGVEVTVNGSRRNISNLGPGEVVIIDIHAPGEAGRH